MSDTFNPGPIQDPPLVCPSCPLQFGHEVARAEHVSQAHPEA